MYKRNLFFHHYGFFFSNFDFFIRFVLDVIQLEIAKKAFYHIVVEQSKMWKKNKNGVWTYKIQ